LEATNTTAFHGKVAWVRRLGHAMIKSVEIQVGGAPIDKHYGVWLDVWYELTHPSGQERGYNAMIGDVPELTELQTSVAGGYNLFVPLQFWFCRNYGLALPLIALQYHDVRLNFELEDLDKLVVYTTGCDSNEKLSTSAPSFGSLTYGSAGVLIDYVYLDSEERRRFAQVGHEYLIEQLQTDGEQQLTSGSQSFTLNFNHPCKEFVWVHKLGAFNGSDKQTNFLGYSGTGDWENTLQEAANNLAKSMLSFANDWTVSTPDVDITSMASWDPNSEPIKVVEVNNTTWKFVAVGSTNQTIAVNILKNPITMDTVNIANSLLDVTVEVQFGQYSTLTSDDKFFTVVAVEHNLNVANLSIPVNSGATYVAGGVIDRRLEKDKCEDVHVVQPSNYGVTLDGKGNIVFDGLLVLNGHDRFQRREGNYFNYVQPWQHHSRTPADGVNVYSFALHPEQHQPTGTANMSRIDNTKLNYKTQDPIRYGKSDLAKLKLEAGTAVWIFATNFNVFRIMSGMGGLAYSN